MSRHGQIMIYGGNAPKHDPLQPESKTFTIIDNLGYTLKLRKTWVPISNVWHIQFLADIAGQEMVRHEYFLSEVALEVLRIAL